MSTPKPTVFGNASKCQSDAGRFVLQCQEYARGQADRTGLRGDREKRSDFGGGPFEGVRQPEVKRHGREFVTKTDEEKQQARDERQIEAGIADENCRLPANLRQRSAAEPPRQQADAEQHDAGRSRAEHHVFKRGFARLRPAFQKAREHVTRQARHFHGEENHQQMIGGRHQHHAERAAEQEDDEIGGIFPVRQAGDPPEQQNEQSRKENQPAQEYGERIELQQTVERGAAIDVTRERYPFDDEQGQSHGTGKHSHGRKVNAIPDPCNAATSMRTMARQRASSGAKRRRSCPNRNCRSSNCAASSGMERSDQGGTDVT